MTTKLSQSHSRLTHHRWFEEYKNNHRELLSQDREFARWFDEEYVPIAGGWAY